MLKKIKNIFLDMLFPIRCLLCGKDGDWICKKCFENIKTISSQTCPYCEKIIVSGGAACQRCREKYIQKNEKLPIDSLATAVRYKDHGISRLIHLFKYRFIQDLSEPLGKIMAKSIISNNLSLPDMIVPIPLHKRRLRWRGFNQSELLANYISSNITPGLEISVIKDVLIRKRYTTPQMKIKNYKKRQKNIQGVFVINKEKVEMIKNKNVLLVDDVATTGSTLFECGRILKSHGAQKISASVIARQEWKNVL